MWSVVSRGAGDRKGLMIPKFTSALYTHAVSNQITWRENNSFVIWFFFFILFLRYLLLSWFQFNITKLDLLSHVLGFLLGPSLVNLTSRKWIGCEYICWSLFLMLTCSTSLLAMVSQFQWNVDERDRCEVYHTSWVLTDWGCCFVQFHSCLKILLRIQLFHMGERRSIALALSLALNLTFTGIWLRYMVARWMQRQEEEICWKLSTSSRRVCSTGH